MAERPWPLVLGSPNLAAYLGPLSYCGAIVGPVANRIANARAVIDGQVHRFDPNESGCTTLHGGSTGLSGLLWIVEGVRPQYACLSVALPDGQGGFPGNRKIRVEYCITGSSTLSLVMSATTDAPTIINLAHHGYWNLDGTENTKDHVLTIQAGYYTPVDPALIPTGEILPVSETPFDFRKGAKFPSSVPIDHNFCLRDSRAATLAFAAELRSKRGPRLRIETTEPGLQVYDCASMSSFPFHGHGGKSYGRYAGLVIEPQAWPDAPNHAHFPSTYLDVGQTYRQESNFILLD